MFERRSGGLTLVAIALSCFAGSASLAADSVSLEALVALEETLAESPDDPEVLLVRARLLRRHGQLESARRDLEHASRHPLVPLDVDLEWAQLLRAAGQPEAARARLEAFLAQRPQHLPARRLLAEVLIDNGRPGPAAREYSFIIAHSEAPSVETYLERARCQEVSGDLGAVIAGLEEGLVNLGPMTVLLERLYRLERRLGDEERALSLLSRLAKETPRSYEWQIERGRYLEELGQPEAATLAWREAKALLRMSPRFESPRLRRLDRELAELLSRQPR